MKTRVLLLAAACVFAAGCKDKKPSTDFTCASNADCTSPGTRCDTASGRCVCSTNEACESGFFCNHAGVCQAVAGCASNGDCATGTYCDISSGQCLSGPPLMLDSACGLSSHC